VPSELQLTDLFMKAQTLTHYQFTSPNSVLLIHHEFEGSIRYVLAFLLLYFSRGFFVYSPPHVHIYIQAFGTQMNTSVIHNTINKKAL
jgi:hypothetical protein